MTTTNKTLQSCVTRKIGRSHGYRRVWLEGVLPERSGFIRGTRYRIACEGQDKAVVLIKDQQGTRIVSGKQKGDRDIPVIDINSDELLAMFDGMDEVRVIFTDEAILLMPLASELKAQARRQRLFDKLAANEPLRCGSMSHGAGILSHALHYGLAEAGITTELVFANDIREDGLVHAAQYNDAWNPNTRLLAMPMQELVQDDGVMSRLPLIEILESGLPCNAASVAARAKKQNQSMPEEDPDVGHLAMSWIMLIARLQPAVIWLENVVPYRSTASMAMIRTMLKDMGYEVQEIQLNGRDFNCLEARERMYMVAVTKGIAFDIDAMIKPEHQALRVADALDDVPPDDPRWNRFDYLKAKEKRDAEKGSSFAMQTVSPEDDHVPTIRKFYHKGGSTDPYLKHPTNPDLLRKFTVAEHARMKSIPVALMPEREVSQTFGHEMLGQSVNYTPPKALAAMMGQQLLNQELVKQRHSKQTEPQTGELPKAVNDEQQQFQLFA